MHTGAELAEDVEIGPYAVIGDQVKLARGVKVHAHVVIEKHTHIGEGTEVYPGAILGCTPQDRKFKGEVSYLIIGSNNIIRECVTLHRATGEGQETRIGDNNLIMAYSHIGHNCRIGSNNHDVERHRHQRPRHCGRPGDHRRLCRHPPIRRASANSRCSAATRKWFRTFRRFAPPTAARPRCWT